MLSNHDQVVCLVAYAATIGIERSALRVFHLALQSEILREYSVRLRILDGVRPQAYLLLRPECLLLPGLQLAEDTLQPSFEVPDSDTLTLTILSRHATLVLEGRNLFLQTVHLRGQPCICLLKGVRGRTLLLELGGEPLLAGACGLRALRKLLEPGVIVFDFLPY